MRDTIFRAMVVSKINEKDFIRQITERSINELPEGEVLVRVRFSSLNYKDGLSCTGTVSYTHLTLQTKRIV